MKINTLKASLLALLVPLVIGCGSTRAADDWTNLPERKLSTYAPALDRPIAERVDTMPDGVLAYLQQMDSSAGFKSYRPSPSELAQFQTYFELLPAAYQKVMQERVARVYFVQDFDSGGMSDVVFDTDRSLYIVLYFNARLLSTSLQDWIAFRDEASFTPSESVTLQSIATGPYTGLIHTLVHEASHIYDFYHHVTPYVEEFQKQSSGLSTTPFVNAVWKDLPHPQTAYDVFQGSKYSRYGLQRRVDRSEALTLYRRLVGSPFASLYGATNWAEDFAEAFSWWYLKTKLNVDYTVTVADGRETVRFSPFADGVPLALSRTGVFNEIVP